MDTVERFRLCRAGVLNVWQYDEQVFEFADGRLLLRGANGAGKSKTLEMLLPFVLDGDKQRITASGRHHTSLLWLMLDGYQGQNRIGYLWVEFARPAGDGTTETVTCGIGVRASQSARTATSWYFTFPGRVGTDLVLEDDAGPLPPPRCRAAVEPDGHYFDSPRAYKQHVGRLLFGLEPVQFDELLRLLYWLRQPQVGEDIEPAKLAEQLAQALPQLDDDSVRAAGDTFDELAAFGEQLDRQRRSAAATEAFARVYADYARAVLRGRGSAVVEAHRELGRRGAEVDRRTAALADLERQRETAQQERTGADGALGVAQVRLRELETDPAMRTQQELVNRRRLADELNKSAGRAEAAAATAAARAEATGRRVTDDGSQLRADLGAHVSAANELIMRSAKLGVPARLVLPSAVTGPALADPDDAGETAAGLAEHAVAARGARPVVGELLAAVEVVDAARREAADATRLRTRAEDEAAKAERDAEEERERLAEAERSADDAERGYRERLDAWRADQRATDFTLPAELSAATLPGIAALARTAAEPALAALRGEEAAAAAARQNAEAELRRLRERRAAVAAEPDPAPDPPALGRGPRPASDGAPLWRLVDFGASLAEGGRAGVEAALESAGLLDAWVRADGAVLDAGTLDVVLPAGPAVRGTSLAGVLVPDPPPGSPVAAQTVGAVLARIGWTDHSTQDGAAVGGDGTWRLGPLTGRAAKPAAQFIGATARAAERARRLAELDGQLAATAEELESATTAQAEARQQREELEAWLSEAPPYGALLTAWVRLDERSTAARRAERRSSEAEQAAAQARAEESRSRRRLADLGAAHGLPTDADGLGARREQLRALDAALARHADNAEPLRARLRRWCDDFTVWQGDLAHAGEAGAGAVEQRERAVLAAAAYRELESAAGASVRELQQRVADTSAEIEAYQARLKELNELVAGLLGNIGGARQALADSAARSAEHQPVLHAAVHALADIVDAPGLLQSGLHDHPDRPDPAGFELARGCTADARPPAAVIALARRLAALDPPGRAVDDNGVYAAWQDAASSAAADTEPRVGSVAGALVAIGRDDAGEHPIAELSNRLSAAVQRDADLLTDRERRLFEEHILGDLGESLRARRLEAEELVAGMNRLLSGVTTSQGIEVRLIWKLRDDTAPDATRAVELLGQPVGALLPDERRELRDALHRLIEASRADAPEDSYAEHLASALDYRRWFAFRIRYTRPEHPGTWHDLHRRSPLSQGEQKVVCYLPLFAAAAAHFSSLAGAAPHAPRFVLLDDAFPKIDVRTHPLLFGLLVQLDLDFVVTSERLWGDHSTVPSLAIYEALRDPSERGIAQYRHVWDGHRLHAIGA